MRKILQAQKLKRLGNKLIHLAKRKDTKILFFLLLLCLSIWLRLPLSNFLPMIGDAGEYINAANYLARTGKTFSNFFPATWVYLAIFSKLFGVNGTPYGHLVMNILSLISFFFLLKELFPKKEWISWLGFIMLIFNPLSIWMARMPYSGNLMIVWNINILLFYNKHIKNPNTKNIFLLNFFLILAFFTRVTSTMWLFIIYADIIFKYIKHPKKHIKIKPFLLWNYTISVYAVTLIYNVLVIPDVFLYRYWQKYFKNITPIKTAVLFIVIWILSNLFLQLLFKFKPINSFINKLKNILKKIKQYINKNKSRKRIVTLIIITVILMTFTTYLYYSLIRRRADIEIYVKNLLFSRQQSFLYIFKEFYQRFNFTYSVNYYFTFFAFIPIIYGIYKTYKQHTKYSLLLSLSTITIIFYSTPVFAKRNHTFYLYYDRYNYPEYFLILFIFMFYGLSYLIKKKYFKLLLSILIIIYFGNSIYWLSFNKNFQYLYNITGTLEFINKETSSEKTIFLNRDNNSIYFYPNLERVLLHPLEITYEKKINETIEIQKEPFDTDPEINCSEITSKTNSIYILSVSPNKNYSLKNVCPNISTQVIAKKDFIITNQEQIYNKFYNPPRTNYKINIIIEEPI